MQPPNTSEIPPYLKKYPSRLDVELPLPNVGQCESWQVWVLPLKPKTLPTPFLTTTTMNPYLRQKKTLHQNPQNFLSKT